MRAFRSGITFVLAAVCVSALPQAAPAAVALQDRGTHRERALALSRLTQPRDVMRQGLAQLVTRDVPAALKRDPDIASLELEYPGVIDAMVAAAVPELMAQFEADIPKLWERFADVYQGRMTPEELGVAHDFYSTPTGQKLIKAAHQSLDTRPILDDAMGNDGGDVSTQSLKRATAGAVANAIGEFDERDKEALVALSKTPVFAKMKAVGPDIQALTAKIINEPDPAREAKIEGLMKAAVENFIARSDAARTGPTTDVSEQVD